MTVPGSQHRAARTRIVPAKSIAIWDRREILIVALPAAVILTAALWFLMQLVHPAPPKVITIATGGTSGAYFRFGKQYAEVLERSGITLRVKATSGSIENMRLLADPGSGIDLALLQGGIAQSSETPRGIVSLGRAFVEPLWVFYRDTATIDMLHQLKGRRIGIGPEGSGTRHLAMALLRSNEVEDANTTFSPLTGKAAADALRAGDLDAVFLAMAPESPIVQSLVRDSAIKLMSFAQAEAYTRHMPYLKTIQLPRGAFDLVRNMPDRDIALVAPVAAVVARTGIHPALSGLMVDAMREVHGKGGLLHRFGEFPQPVDPELELAPDVERYYKAGPSFLKRFLPFWFATFIERMIVLAVPVAGLLIPMIKVVPLIYKWRVKRRLLYWYSRLKVLEGQITSDPTMVSLAVPRAEIEQIDRAVSLIPVPLGFSEEYYNLRSAIELVRQRVLSQIGRVHPNLT